MRHRSLREMIDELLEDPAELFITSQSRRFALIALQDGTTLFLEGDFSGSPEEREAEARRIMNSMNQRGRNGQKHSYR